MVAFIVFHFRLVSVRRLAAAAGAMLRRQSAGSDVSVSISFIILVSYTRRRHLFCVSLVFYSYFVFVLFSFVVVTFPFGRLLVLNFSLVVPAICNFLLHICICFLSK